MGKSTGKRGREEERKRGRGREEEGRKREVKKLKR
jgi:hypothetical protein